MKAVAAFVAVLALCLLGIPMLALNHSVRSDSGSAIETEAPVHKPPVAMTKEILEDSFEEAAEDVIWEESGEDAGEATAYEPVTESDTEPVLSFKILDASSGKVSEIPLRDFVRGAVAAEMPATFHAEALKAQAVAAHTFALHNHIVQNENPDPKLKGADFEADPSNMKVYITEAKAREFYGDSADFYWNKICTAADEVVNYVIEYDDEPIVAAYHAISSGMTEDAANVWTGSAPYLLAVESMGDLLAPGFETTVTLDEGDVKAKLAAAYPDIELGSDAGAWFGEPERSNSGYVTEIGVGNQILHGKDIRQLFELRSHDFEINHDNATFIFTVTGYGHGVGLSQYGADFLARQGKSFDEILDTYYTGAVLKSIAAG